MSNYYVNVPSFVTALNHVQEQLRFTLISRTSSFSFPALFFDMGWNLNPDVFFGVRKMDP